MPSTLSTTRRPLSLCSGTVRPSNTTRPSTLAAGDRTSGTSSSGCRRSPAVSTRRARVRHPRFARRRRRRPAASDRVAPCRHRRRRRLPPACRASVPAARGLEKKRTEAAEGCRPASSRSVTVIGAPSLEVMWRLAGCPPSHDGAPKAQPHGHVAVDRFEILRRVVADDVPLSAVASTRYRPGATSSVTVPAASVVPEATIWRRAFRTVTSASGRTSLPSVTVMTT